MKCLVCKHTGVFIEVGLSNNIKVNEWYDMEAKLWACPICHTVKLGTFLAGDLEKGEIR